MTADIERGWLTADEQAQAIVQAGALKEQASQGGLRFDVYLPPDLAEWLLEHIEEGVFADPSEAVFVILGEHRDLEPHADLRRELLKRVLQASIDDPRPSIPLEDVKEHLEKRMAAPRSEPATWRRGS